MIAVFGVFFTWHLFPELRLASPHGLHLPTKFTDLSVLEL